MKYKLFVDCKNSDRFDVDVFSEDIAKTAMARIKRAIELKETTVEATDSWGFRVEEIIAYSYDPIPSFWDCFKSGSKPE